MTKKLPLVLLFFFFIQFCSAQVGIGTTNPSASSALEIRSTNSGLLIPRVALTSSTDTTTIPAPATSLMIYNTSTVSDITPGFYYWEGSWKKFSAGTTPNATTGGWNLTGNTVTSSDYLGTNNYFPLIFRVNGNQFSRFHLNGGLAMGIGAAANDNNSVAIGTSATATTSNQAVAIGPSSNAAGYQSVAIGLNSATSNNSNVAIGSSANASGFQSFSFGLSSASSNNNAFAIGNSSSASGQQALAIGQEANSSGQNATAIGYQASTNQANAIVLGNSANANNKIGIGTNTPDERLHVVGSFKLVDGTQANNYILTSDANGRASWKAPAASSTSSGWSLSGNTVTAADYLGTNNYFPLIFRVNNSQFSRFHPNGGLAIGSGAAASDSNGIAIGTSATATNSNQAIAIGQSSNASGFQSVAIGLSSGASNNSAAAFGLSASASGQSSTAVGYQTAASGQNSTAIGYQATTAQANAIVLGSSTNTNNKVGIGTNTPDERLHVVGSVKIVDGTQANNYVLTSDAGGKASWKDLNASKAYAELSRNSNFQLPSGTIAFTNTGENANMNAVDATNGIQIRTAGVYRISYSLSVSNSSSTSSNISFFLHNGSGEMGTTRSYQTVPGNNNENISFTKLIYLNTGQTVTLRSEAANTNINILANSASLMVELVK